MPSIDETDIRRLLAHADIDACGDFGAAGLPVESYFRDRATNPLAAYPDIAEYEPGLAVDFVTLISAMWRTTSFGEHGELALVLAAAAMKRAVPTPEMRHVMPNERVDTPVAIRQPSQYIYES